MVKENKEERNEGLRAVALIKALKTNPIPTPAPLKPKLANPDPIILADCNILKITIYFNKKENI